MQERTKEILNGLTERYPALKVAKNDISAAFEALLASVKNGGKIMICGNGGSAADSAHIVGELMKSFKKTRPIDAKTAARLKEYGKEGARLALSLEGAIPAVALTENGAFLTAFSNDKDASVAFAQQVYGLGEQRDALVCISTSGNSENCVLAAVAAKATEIKTVALTGAGGGKLASLADVCVKVPEMETYKVQELHLPVYHCICAMLEEEIF